MVKQCGGTVEQCWWNSGTVLVEQWNRDSGTVLMEERGGTVEQCWKNNGTVSVEQCGGTVEHC